LNFGNVQNTWKYFAHVGCAYLFFGKYHSSGVPVHERIAGPSSSQPSR
jgi:hypothetical protein